MIRAEIINPMYDHEGRKYLDLLIDGTFTTVKVPWRYGRVLGCHVEGLRPIQDLKADETVQVLIQKKSWAGKVHLVLSSIKPMA
jgi:hypothetical protein